MKTVLSIFFTLLSLQSAAQEVSGRVWDKDMLPITKVFVRAYCAGTLKGEDSTDGHGYYAIKPLDAGLYSILFLYNDTDTFITRKVSVRVGKKTTENAMIYVSVSSVKIWKEFQAYIKTHLFSDSLIQYAIPAIGGENAKDAYNNEDDNVPCASGQETFPHAIENALVRTDARSGHPIKKQGCKEIIEFHFYKGAESFPHADYDNPDSYIYSREQIIDAP